MANRLPETAQGPALPAEVEQAIRTDLAGIGILSDARPILDEPVSPPPPATPVARPRQWPWYALQIGTFFSVWILVLLLLPDDKKNDERGILLGAAAAFGLTFLLVVIQNLWTGRGRLVVRRDPAHATEPRGHAPRLIRSGRPGGDSA